MTFRPHIGTRLAILVLVFATSTTGLFAEWQQALPGWKYDFPKDHWPHPGFKTEWWYFTGQLHTKDERRFGYQVTFFRQGIRPPEARAGTASRLLVNDLSFGHAALTDVSTSQFRYTQKLARGSFGEAGFGEGTSANRIAWIEPWELRLDEMGNYVVTATVEDAKLQLTHVASKPWIIHGQDGVSQKAAGPGRASHYYSGTRLQTSGTLTINGEQLAVRGESWFDHEWATNQLTPEQAGWDWFSLQFDDQSELMLYQMRLKNGGIDPHSSGTFVAPNGDSIHLKAAEYRLTPLHYWVSPKSGARYPIVWKVEVERLGIALQVSTPLASQELHLEPVAYWEGLVDVTGTRSGKPVRGHGYVELTGYAGELVGLSSADPSQPSARPDR